MLPMVILVVSEKTIILRKTIAAIEKIQQTDSMQTDVKTDVVYSHPEKKIKCRLAEKRHYRVLLKFPHTTNRRKSGDLIKFIVKGHEIVSKAGFETTHPKLAETVNSFTISFPFYGYLMNKIEHGEFKRFEIC